VVSWIVYEHLAVHDLVEVAKVRRFDPVLFA
jgi:hypothetical protein